VLVSGTEFELTKSVFNRFAVCIGLFGIKPVAMGTSQECHAPARDDPRQFFVRSGPDPVSARVPEYNLLSGSGSPCWVKVPAFRLHTLAGAHPVFS